MWFKVIMLLILFLICIAPILLDGKLKVEEGITMYEELERIRKRYKNNRPRYTGPRTDDRIDQMLMESILLLKGLGVPISESICPKVFLNGSHSYFGKCCPKGSKKKYSDYEFYIEISGYTLKNSEKSLRNTLIHELIHTVPGGLCHTGEWKKWAKFVSDKTDFHITRCGVEDETEKDLDNLHHGVYEKGFDTRIRA